MTTLHGPADGEGPVRRYGPVGRVAVLSDVHANVPALTAVLADVEQENVDLVVFTGDLTWGPDPDETVEIVSRLGDRALFARGNGERAVLEFAAGTRAEEMPRGPWMVTRHSPASLGFVRSIPFSLVVEVTGLGPVRFCHGSPRSDIEVVTPRTPDGRMAELAALIDERVLVTGHTHVQFARVVGGLRSANPGSVGLPFHTGVPGTAYWALLGPDIVLRQSRYDVEDSIARCHAVDDPGAERYESTLRTPPVPAETIARGESLVFSD